MSIRCEKKGKKFNFSKAKVFFTFLAFSGVFFFCAFLIFSTLYPPLPKENAPILLYANQCKSDLKMTLVSAIKKAKSSLYLITFGLNDPLLLQTLEDKAKKHIPIKIFYDKKASPHVATSQPHMCYPLKTTGFMHQKILVVDQSQIFLGSANMTHTSLNMHDNLIIGIFCPPMAKFILENAPFYSGHFQTVLGKQTIDLWLLPDKNEKALHHLQTCLRTAKKSLSISMFTLTHPLLLQEIIQAKKRGVDIKIFIDFHSSLGASLPAIELLKKENIPIFVNQGSEIFHHKYAYIDRKILICGSTNWTKSAFQKNHDCFLILNHLKKDQKKFLDTLEKASQKASVIQTENLSL